MTHIDLFSGIGGFTLATEWAGFRTVVFCEKDEFCQKVLEKYWSEIPIIEEIRDFDGTKWSGATLLTGGFPCQPFSVAGQRRGKEDDRYLWPEMLRVINEAKPRWILAENVPGIFRMALDTVLSDLEGEGYSTGTLIIPACGLNAPHKRNRVWIVANSVNDRMRRWNHGDSGKSKRSLQAERPNSHASDSTQSRQLREAKQEDNGTNCPRRRRYDPAHKNENNWQIPWIEIATRLCRVDDGVPNRVDRLKALGNAIVPQIAYEIMKNIRIIEERLAQGVL